jgi:hypothetical protein
MRQASTFAAIIALVGILADSGPAFAHGAIAYDNESCAFGRSWNYPTPDGAADKAMAECKHPGCKIVAKIGPRQCGALAVTANCKGYGWAVRPSKDAAELKAMQDCQRDNTGQCSVKVSDCDR